MDERNISVKSGGNIMVDIIPRALRSENICKIGPVSKLLIVIKIR